MTRIRSPGSATAPGGHGSASPTLVARGVEKRFGEVLALDGVDLEVRDGECVALVGESGSGKTTLLRTFNRMVVPDRGRIRVGGRAVEAWDAVTLRRHTGYVQQEGGLLPHWTVLRNAALVPALRGMDDPEALARDALAEVGLAPEAFGARWPRELSGGQRQRVAIARALAARPDVLLMDEPFGALDAITRADLQEAFHELQTRRGVTSLLVTHDLREALFLADRIAVLRRGRLQQVAPAAELRERPATEYVRRLLERAGVGA